MTVTLNLAIAGLGIGAVAALAGLGLLVTYRATGVFNLAFGAVAVLAAYLVYELNRTWHWPIGLAALVVLAGVCPLLGAALDRLVFRPIRRRDAGAAESLVGGDRFAIAVGGGGHQRRASCATDAPPALHWFRSFREAPAVLIQPPP